LLAPLTCHVDTWPPPSLPLLLTIETCTFSTATTTDFTWILSLNETSLKAGALKETLKVHVDSMKAERKQLKADVSQKSKQIKNETRKIWASL
jgi:hypothetical protein